MADRTDSCLKTRSVFDQLGHALSDGPRYVSGSADGWEGQSLVDLDGEIDPARVDFAVAQGVWHVADQAGGAFSAHGLLALRQTLGTFRSDGEPLWRREI